MQELEFLQSLKSYIKRMEAMQEQEWGSCRPLEELIETGDMPEVYKEVVKRLSDL